MPVSPSAPNPPAGAPTPRAADRPAPQSAPRTARSGTGAWVLSAAVHLVLIGGLAGMSLLAPPPPPTVAVFELVSVERPKLRPIAPKTPEPPAEKPPESRPPEASRLTPTPYS